jgi:imidazolonepropionase-like amidohydrolase
VPILITADAVIDGSGAVHRPGAVFVDGKRVVAVDHRVPTPPGTERAHFEGGTILPGLIDCHVHLSDAGLPDATVQDSDPPALRSLRIADHARRKLDAGFTTVRDVGGRDHLEFGFRRAVAEGLARAPRLVLAGKIISITTAGASAWRGMYRQADGPQELVKAVREQVAAGADVIKLMATGAVLSPAHEQPGAAQLTPAELRAAVETAHALGRRVAAHAHGIEGIRRAVDAGVDTIEHGTQLHEDRAVARAMAKRGVFLVPTLKTLPGIADGPGVPEHFVAKERDRRADRDTTFRTALEDGVPIAMGTDAATPLNRHGENAQELAIMVELGMSAMAAILATTAEAARAIGRDDVGVLSAGKLADLAIWRGDPLGDIRVLERPPQAVFLGGTRIV